MKTMKTLGYSLMIFCGSLTMLTSCGDDGDELGLIGSFALSEESTSGCNDAADNSVKAKTCSETSCETLILSGDGTFSVVDLDNGITTSYSGKYVTSGNQITFTYTIDSVTETDVVTFSLSGSTLILTEAQEADGCIDTETYTRN